MNDAKHTVEPWPPWDEQISTIKDKPGPHGVLFFKTDYDRVIEQQQRITDLERQLAEAQGSVKSMREALTAAKKPSVAVSRLQLRKRGYSSFIR